MNFAIDVMGGDNAPKAALEGVRLALEKLPEDTCLTLYGTPEALVNVHETYGFPEERVHVEFAAEVIGCDESPTIAIRRKKDSSMVRALRDTADKKADCIISAGSTGALLTGGTLIIKRIPGVKRPALGTVLPAINGCTMLMDSGANTDCKVEYLEQFAVMGSVYMREVMDVAEPRVGLLNNGTEAEKGNELTKAAYPRMSGLPIRFTGNCEARDILGGEFDLVVADGFDGNVALKSLEGTAALMMTLLKKELMADTRSKIGAALARPALKRVKKALDYAEYGGAPLLGINGGLIKAHGSSDAKAFMNAIFQAQKLMNGNVIDKIAKGIAEAGITED